MKRLLVAAVSFLAAAAAGVAAAAGSVSFEFSPDGGEPLRLVAFEEPYELFTPQNDYISGVDFWIENEGDAGEASFGLRDPQNQLLTAATAQIPYTASRWGGKKLHIDFPSSIRLSQNGAYRVRLLTSMSSLKIYYAPRPRILEHNASYPGAFLWGAAELDAELQDFSFKFATYETQESLAPEVTNASSTVLSPREARVSWNANEPVDGRVEFAAAGSGVTQQAGPTGEYRFCGAAVAPCALTLSVFPNMLYHYMLSVADEWGNETAVSGMFVTPSEGTVPTAVGTPTMVGEVTPPEGPADQMPPVISNARVVATGGRWVRVVWSTNEPANSELLIERGVESITSATDYAFEMEHLIQTEENLRPSTSYTATIISRDPSNNYSSKTLTFTTTAEVAAPPPAPPPIVPVITETISGAQPLPTPPPSSSQSGTTDGQAGLQTSGTVNATTTQTGSGAIISWEAPAEEPEGGYRVDVFDEEHRLVAQIAVSAGTHGVNLEDLPSGNYTVIVYANRAGVYERIGAATNLNITKLTFLQRFLYVWYAALIAILAAALAIFLIQRRRRTS